MMNRDSKVGQIAELLPVGKENAISTSDLMVVVGVESPRMLRSMIAKERKTTVICSTTSGGYFLPANRQETAEFCKSLENRAKNTFAAIQSARRALGIPEGQQGILLDDIERQHEEPALRVVRWREKGQGCLVGKL
ncbi:MAG: hypothetical protein FWE25_08265 [Lachnospiraceae bacterium]|nr:hypothetical protein [Lachnospiraceae bacterium]